MLLWIFNGPLWIILLINIISIGKNNLPLKSLNTTIGKRNCLYNGPINRYGNRIFNILTSVGHGESHLLIDEQ